MQKLNWLLPALLAAGTAALTGCETGKTTVQSPVAGDISPSVSQLATAAGNTTAANESGMRVEPVALFSGTMPTGVAVSHDNRVFLNFPRWSDPVEYSVLELLHGVTIPYPDNLITRLHTDDPSQSFISPQSVVVDGLNHLWVLDPGSINMGRTLPGGPKLVEVDLVTSSIVRTIPFPSDVCLPTSYLNDVRLDLSHGASGTAYISDSSGTGPNAIIVVDLASGKTMRRLNDHPSVKAEPNFVPNVEGSPMTLPGGAALQIGVDGIAVSPDGSTLYYSALAGHHLYSVPTDSLRDPSKTDADIADAVKDLGDRGFASDGLLCDAAGTLYLTDYEHNAIRTRKPDGSYSVLVSDPRMLWPDSMSIGGDGFLYFTCNQLERSAMFHNGTDLRKQPYVLFRVNVHQKPSNPGGTIE